MYKVFYLLIFNYYFFFSFKKLLELSPDDKRALAYLGFIFYKLEED